MKTQIKLSHLYRLRGAGVLAAERFSEAAWSIRDRDGWAMWALRALLALGTGHLLAGIIFFFAYNWADMPALAKFAVLEVGIAASAVGAVLVGLRKHAGQALLIAASVFVGGLLAVIGQVYQTGADAYELFVAWCLLILPWTLISRSAVQWIVWLAVLYAAMAFYCAQVLIPLDRLSGTQTGLVLGGLLILGLVVRELAAKTGFEWIDVAWVRYMLVVLAIGHFFAVGSSVALDFSQENLSVPILIAVLVAGLAVYRWIVPDFAAFAVSVAYGGFFLMVVGGRVIHETIEFDFGDNARLMLSLVLLIAWCVFITGAMGKLFFALRPNDDGEG